MLTKEAAADWLAHAIADDELAHYGVLGMHWGHRKNPTNVTPSTTAIRRAKNKKIKTAALITAGVLGGTAALAAGSLFVGKFANRQVSSFKPIASDEYFDAMATFHDLQAKRYNANPALVPHLEQLLKQTYKAAVRLQP